MELSKYQEAILSHGRESNKNLCVVARAGSGKTFTIKKLARQFQSNVRILFVAFNKHIADALKKDLPPNVEAATLNAFGWRICMREVKGLNKKVDAYKTESIYKTFFNMNDKKDRNQFYATKNQASRLVSLFKANTLTEIPDFNEVIDIADRYGIDIGDDATQIEMIKQVYGKCLQYWTIMDFDDQVFMPIYLNLPIPQYDVVIVDESQDLNPIQQELVIRAGNRVICVGDDRQAIYGFRGADPKSMDNMREKLNADVLPLSICYRCPKSVVDLAKTIVPDIEAGPDAKDGIVREVKRDVFERDAKDGDYVLCRTTAPLVSGCLKFIREGRKAVVRGRDIGQQLMSLVKKISPESYEPIEQFRDKLQNYRNNQLERLQRAEREAEIIALNDRVDTILVLIERCERVADIEREVEQIFADERTLADGTVIKLPGVVFCTVHKSKGLEAEVIWIIEPQLMPHPAAKTEEQKLQEMNLKYVAITRSLDTLNWVKNV
jgi:DNA helicase-2/ATP-dependent DNA helicase PcrA